ncbi:hypothetical protein F5141DRAFT_1079070, partial [Pisolithus sp. B1]
MSSLFHLSHYSFCCLIRLSEMFNKMMGKIIPFRTGILWRRDKSARTPHDYAVPIPPASDLQPLTVDSSSVLSFRNISDVTQIALPVVQAAVAAIPVVGAPLASAIGALLAVIRAMDASIQNHEALGSLTHRLYTLSCHIANAPAARTQSEEAIRRALIKVLEDTTDELRKMRTRLSGSVRLTQDIAGCFSKINDSLFEFMVLYQMQLTEVMHTQLTKTDYICRAMMALEGRLPAIMTTSCMVVVDATGEEHNMLFEQCRSFDRLIAFLPGILSQCRPDRAHIQRWYIDRGQYDFVIDNGTNITQLTRESDIWSTIQPGTKIVMRVITTEVSRTFSASYQCHCGKWNEVKVDQGAVLDALKDGFIITCYYCERRFQITVTKARKELRAQGEKSKSKDDGPAEEEKSLIRNIWKKQVPSTVHPQWAIHSGAC